jgi:hypothetical protein
LPTTLCAEATTSEELLHAALARQDAWLGADQNAAQWRLYLLDGQLESLLHQGSAADPVAVGAVLAQYRSGAPGLELGPFAEVRRSLTAWWNSLPAPKAEDLPAKARAMKAVFFPYTPVDQADAKAELLAAIERLNAALAGQGARGDDWRQYLTLETLQQQLARTEGPDLPALDGVYRQFAAGYEGLRLYYFADLRLSLRRYLTVVRAMQQPQLRQQYEKILDTLAGLLEAYLKAPSLEGAQRVNAILDWLDQAEQASWLVESTRRRWSHPNVVVEGSKALVASRIAGPVSETTPVRDCILGTDIHGTGLVKGEVTVELVPSDDQAIVDTLFRGTIDTDTIGYNGPATIYATGTTTLSARKRLLFHGEQLSTRPATSSATVASSINDIQARHGLIERFAWKRAMKQKALAESIAASHAEDQFNERMDKQADGLIARANESLLQKFRRPLADRNLLPKVFRLSTTADAVQLTVQAEGFGHLAAPHAPPHLAGAGDLTVRVHETAINNVTAAVLAGIVLDEKRFQELLTESLGLPERIQTTDGEAPWSIAFPERQPVAVSFADGGFTVTISGRQFTNEGKEYPGMNVTAAYRIQKTDRGLRALRQGKLRIFPPGFKPDSGQQLSAREQVLRNALEPRFGKLFTEELAPANIVLKEDPAASPGQARPPVELALTRWEAAGGWLVMAWKMVTVP